MARPSRAGVIRRRDRARMLGLVLLAAALAPGGLRAQAPCPEPQPVFDELQRQVWYLPTDDGRARLYVTSMGCGPTVVVLHGGPGNDFNYLVSALRPLRSQYRFVLFDQRASLLSPVPAADRETLTLDVLVEDLETLRRALGEERLLLFGHSWGTMLAQAYYRAHPERVAGLVLTGAAPPRADSARPFLDYVRAARPRMRALQERPAVARALEEAGVTRPDDGAPLPPQLDWARFRIRQAAMNIVHVEQWRELHGGGVYYSSEVDDAIGGSLPATYDLAPALAHHPVPITILQGDHDYVDPGASTWHELAAAGQAHIEVLHDAGHYAWIDAPGAFESALRAGLARTRLTAPPHHPSW